MAEFAIRHADGSLSDRELWAGILKADEIPDRLEKDWNESDHPRVPAGSEDGGRFTSAAESYAAGSHEDFESQSVTEGGEYDFEPASNERDALRHWVTPTGYKEINEPLRAGAEPSAIVKQLDSAIAKSKTKSNVTIARAIHPDLAKTFLDGTVVHDLGFSAGSTSESFARNIATMTTGVTPEMVRIELPRGTPALALRNVLRNTKSPEVLLPRGGSFLVRREASGIVLRWTK